MVAAISIAPAEANTTDELVAKRQPLLMRCESPLLPKEQDFTARDLGVHLPERPVHHEPASVAAQDAGVSTAADVATLSVSTEGVQRALSAVPIRLPLASPLTYTFELRQQWEGVVTAIAKDEFTVILRDLVNSSAPELDAVLPLEEVPNDDLPLLKLGAVLYWTIGYEQTQTGQRKRTSTIRLRRLPAWSRAEMDRVAKRAKDLEALFSD